MEHKFLCLVTDGEKRLWTILSSYVRHIGLMLIKKSEDNKNTDTFAVLLIAL